MVSSTMKCQLTTSVAFFRLDVQQVVLLISGCLFNLELFDEATPVNVVLFIYVFFKGINLLCLV